MVTVQAKRYLIVVDGVGSYNVLQDLKDAFPDENNGSKVIFTSRRISKLKKLNPHIMNRLNDYQSWKMFLNRAGKEKEADEITARLKGKILTVCNGSPHNIMLMAGLLSNNEIKRWSTVINDGQCPDDALRICYNDLSIHLKLCLLYLALFPKDYEFPVRRLLWLWRGDGCMKLRLQDLFPDDPVQECFEKLVGRNIIQITKLRSDNSPRRCRLVSVFHDYLLQKAQHIGLFYILLYPENFKDAAGPFGVGLMTQYIITKRAVDPSPLKSYVFFNFQLKDMLENQVGRALGRIIRSDVALLCHFRCSESPPESVRYLSDPETADLKQTNINILSNYIKELRHLNLNTFLLPLHVVSLTIVSCNPTDISK